MQFQNLPADDKTLSQNGLTTFFYTALLVLAIASLTLMILIGIAYLAVYVNFLIKKQTWSFYKNFFTASVANDQNQAMRLTINGTAKDLRRFIKADQNISQCQQPSSLSCDDEEVANDRLV